MKDYTQAKKSSSGVMQRSHLPTFNYASPDIALNSSPETDLEKSTLHSDQYNLANIFVSTKPLESNQRNRTCQMTSKLPIQAKLTIGEPNDKYEQEADQIAARVVNQIHTPNAQKPAQEKLVQQRQCTSSLNLQRLANEHGISAPDGLAASINQAKSGGHPLPEQLSTKLETAMGSDLSGVKVHTDATSDRLNGSLSSRAFTTKNHIFFKQGEYDPGSLKGQTLIAHEITHYLQQRNVSPQFSDGLIQRAVGFEFETAAIAEKMNTPLTRKQKNGKQSIFKSEIDPKGLKKGDVLVPGNHFELQVDEPLSAPPGVMNLEFVTTGQGFPETSSGRQQLKSTMVDITKLSKKIISKYNEDKPPYRYIASRKVTPDKPVTPNEQAAVFPVQSIGGKSAKPESIIWAKESIGASPQATAGIRLDQLPYLMETAIGSGVVETTTEKDQRNSGRSYLAGGGETDRPIVGLAPGKARFAVQRFPTFARLIGDSVPPVFGSNELIGLLALIRVYLTVGQKTLQDYVKTIAPLMARTDFAALFQLLPQNEKDYFKSKPLRFVNLALLASEKQETGKTSIFSGGMKDVKGYDATALKVLVHDLKSLSREKWLENIVLGKDLLTQINFPRKGTADAIETLGGLGGKTETVGKKRRHNSTQTEAPIFELRRMGKDLPLEDWTGFALDIFDYIKALNDQKRPTFSEQSMQKRRKK